MFYERGGCAARRSMISIIGLPGRVEKVSLEIFSLRLLSFLKSSWEMPYAILKRAESGKVEYIRLGKHARAGSHVE